MGLPTNLLSNNPCSKGCRYFWSNFLAQAYLMHFGIPQVQKSSTNDKPPTKCCNSGFKNCHHLSLFCTIITRFVVDDVDVDVDVDVDWWTEQILTVFLLQKCDLRQRCVAYVAVLTTLTLLQWSLYGRVMEGELLRFFVGSWSFRKFRHLFCLFSEFPNKQ